MKIIDLSLPLYTGMPLSIKEGDGSPIRAFAVVN